MEGVNTFEFVILYAAPTDAPVQTLTPVIPYLALETSNANDEAHFLLLEDGSKLIL